MSVRAAVIVTGTEVLSGAVRDANGPWLSERLRTLGVDCARITIVGDRPADMLTALEDAAGLGVRLIITSGGLGPTADDLTGEIVARFCGRPLELDTALEARVRAIVERLSARWPDRDPAAMAAGWRKQALVPAGATVLEPVGTAPGFVIGSSAGATPAVLVLPGPPGELVPMFEAALAAGALAEPLAGASELRTGMVRLFGIPEADLAQTLRMLEAEGLELGALEITTCLRDGELELSTTFPPAAERANDALRDAVVARHGAHVFAPGGETVDELVADALVRRGFTIATAESCTGGLMAGRLTARAGSSAYVRGGLVVYSDAAKTALAGVGADVIARHGAVSEPVAALLADGARRALDADVGVGITGIAGPGGGTAEKPVGTVYVSVALGDGRRSEAALKLGGGRTAIRQRTLVHTLHLLLGLLR